MKLLYKTEKYKRHSASIARHNLKRLRLKKRRVKYDNRILVGKSKEERQEWNTKKRYARIIKAPTNFSFLDNPQSVTQFLKKIENVLTENKSLYVEMKAVNKIDYATISSLLAVCYRFKKNNIKFNGNFPVDQISKDLLVKSGFLYTLFSNNPDAGHKYNINADNQLFTLNERKIEISGEIVKSVSEFIFGKKRKLSGLYTTLGELMDNTISWASKKQDETEQWWISINYDKSNKKVSFVFIDYGIGIFNSLADKEANHPIKKILKRAQKTFGLDATEKQLKMIVTESAGRTYKLSGGHGQGIYGIYQALQRKQLSKLYIISNNAFGNIENDKYEKLDNELSGTLYYWEICDKNV